MRDRLDNLRDRHLLVEMSHAVLCRKVRANNCCFSRRLHVCWCFLRHSRVRISCVALYVCTCKYSSKLCNDSRAGTVRRWWKDGRSLRRGGEYGRGKQPNAIQPPGKASRRFLVHRTAEPQNLSTSPSLVNSRQSDDAKTRTNACTLRSQLTPSSSISVVLPSSRVAFAFASRVAFAFSTPPVYMTKHPRCKTTF